MTKGTAVLVDPASLLPDAGVNTALSWSVPTGSVDVDVDAAPALTVTGPPMSVGVPVPNSNWTVPDADGLTLAFSVTEVPANWGLEGDAVRVVVVGIPSISMEAVPVEAP
jgi:hypothetical protein